MRRRTRAAALAALTFAGSAAFAGFATAGEVKMAVRTDASSIDPHYHVYSPNTAVYRHIFDTLTLPDPRGVLKPGLAMSWTPVADDIWEFKLRPDVTFHDGGPFTSDDVAFSIARAPNVPNSPSSYAQYTKAVARTEIVDPLTIRIHTKGPAPLLPSDMAWIAIVSKRVAAGKASSDFNNGTAAIGTGAYKFVEWVAANYLTLARNDAYWGGAEPWDRVTRRPIANDGARVATLLSGDVDLIEGVPAVDRARLLASPNLALHEIDSFRIVYLHMDSARDDSPGISDFKGEKIARNPLKDVRVRRAISLAINRPGLVDRLLSGQARPAGQYVPEAVPGASPNLPALPYDPIGAQALLKEAGWGDGFSVVLAGSNDRYPSDAQVTQAVGQMLARVGIRADVQTMPAAMLFTRGTKLEFSMMLSGWVGTGEAASPLVALMATYDAKTGLGGSNRGRWSNPAFDAALGAALRTLDDTARNGFFARAAEIAVEDMGVVPVYFTINTWASRKSFIYRARMDETTLATGFRPAK